MIKLKKGETVEPIIKVPVTIVTKENVDQYRDDVQVNWSDDRSRGADCERRAADRLHNPRWIQDEQWRDHRVRMSGISKRYGAIQTLDDVST